MSERERDGETERQQRVKNWPQFSSTLTVRTQGEFVCVYVRERVSERERERQARVKNWSRFNSLLTFRTQGEIVSVCV